MLITKEVEVKLGRNIKWYEKKGYYIPRYKDEKGRIVIKKGTSIKVRVEDLPKGSCEYVKVSCDCKDCTTPIIKPIKWCDYLKSVREDGKYYCRKCALNLYGMSNRNKNKLKNGEKSFYDWCIKNNKQDVLNRWDYELNNCSPQEVTYGSHGFNNKGYWFKCPKGNHDSEQKNINNFTSVNEKSTECNQCNSFAQWGIDNICSDFLNKYWDWNKNNELGINPWKISRRCHKRVWIKCQKKNYHDSYDIQCDTFVSGTRCSYCKGSKVHPLDSLGQYIINNYGKEFLDKIWSDKNNKSPFEYTPFSEQKIWWKCIDNKHDDYKRMIKNSNKQEFRCPKCVQKRKESLLQEKVRLYLESLNNGQYVILHEYNCTIVPINPKTNKKLPFDNEIKELKLIIEVNGRQHYKELSGKWFDENFDLHKLQLHDRYKKFIAYKNGYEYIVIPYWIDDDNETWKQLINNKINEILTIQMVS